MANEIMNKVEEIIKEAEAMRSSYFFRSPASAGARRRYEQRHSHSEVNWIEGGHTYSASYEVRCSCSTIYASGVYMRDGKKTTLTAIKNSYKRMGGN